MTAESQGPVVHIERDFECVTEVLEWDAGVCVCVFSSVMPKEEKTKEWTALFFWTNSSHLCIRFRSACVAATVSLCQTEKVL